MPVLFKRQSNIQCFFCSSTVPIPQNTRNFKCPSCSCWNRYDEHGEIISDEPAMHEERLNSRSFMKRAAPRKDRIPTMYGPGPFCHTCQTNQMLIINLLSNYLPDPESSEYQSRLDMLPAYQESLHIRYPPVCDSCLPQVEEELRSKEQMARAKALGGYLSKGKDRKRRVSGTSAEKKELASDVLFWWKIRGFLWVSSLCVSVVGTLSAAYDSYPFSRFSFLRPILPLIVVMSLLWTAWDPTYAKFKFAQLQGRDVRIRGKQAYNRLQILAWFTRLCLSIIVSLRWFRARSPNIEVDAPEKSKRKVYLLLATFIEIMANALSWYFLRIQQPPAIRLVDTQAHTYDRSRSGTPLPADLRSPTPSSQKFPTIPDADALLSMSLSSKPVITPRPHPVFGLPSLQSSLPATTPPQPQNKEDEMDWTPTNPVISHQQNETEDSYSWLRPQRFFAPEKPTGLEGLLQSTRIQDELIPLDSSNQKKTLWNYLWDWRLSFTILLGILVALIACTLKWFGLITWVP
ncbi:hypothetical protein CPC08DRAFT_130459 [Agrocybe pediades]|nr:hypothetical protein CPC08DRAFT_130459 [Agrocybe pediades]